LFSKKIIFEIHQWDSFLFQGFQNHFHKYHLSVPNLEFFFCSTTRFTKKDVMLTIKPLTQRISRCGDRGHP
jgi:hypothetical protein